MVALGSRHSSLEMRAVHCGVSALQNRISIHSLVLMTDNSSVVAYLSKQEGMVSVALCQLTWEIFKWVELLAVKISSFIQWKSQPDSFPEGKPL